MRKIAGQPEDE